MLITELKKLQKQRDEYLEKSEVSEQLLDVYEWFSKAVDKALAYHQREHGE
jgi:hypothetical protein